MRLLAPLIFALTSATGMCQDPVLEPLPGALWRGTLEMIVKGDQFTQAQVGGKTPEGRPEFIKEKGQMAVDLRLTIEFQIDGVGEVSLLAREAFTGSYSVVWSSHSQAKEVYLKNEVKESRLVMFTKSRETSVDFQYQATKSKDQLGDLAIRPNGKLDGKGDLDIAGDFVLSYEGSGTYEEEHTRQPPNAKEPNTKKKAPVKKIYKVPVSFNLKVALAGKPVSGALKVLSDPKTPFPQDGPTANQANYRSSIAASGTYRLDPLFGKP